MSDWKLISSLVLICQYFLLRNVTFDISWQRKDDMYSTEHRFYGLRKLGLKGQLKEEIHWLSVISIFITYCCMVEVVKTHFTRKNKG